MQGRSVGRAGMLLLAMTCIVLLNGCIAFPIPRDEGNVTSPPGGMERPWKILKIGETTRKYVYASFDSPYRQWYADRVWVYRWKTSNMGVVWAFGGFMGAAAGEFPVTKDQYLFIEFDRQGVVSRFEVKHDGMPADMQKDSWPSADVRGAH